MPKVDQTFKVLGKILTEETTTQLNTREVNQLFQNFFQYMTNEFYPVIDNSSYENKANLLSNLKSTMKEIEFIINTPQLQDKTIVVIEGGKHTVPKWFDENGMSEYSKYVKQNSNIPMILSAADSSTIYVQNMLGNLNQLTYEEFEHTNRQLYKNKIDINQFIQAFYIEGESPYKHIAFIYLPQYYSRTNEMYEMLLNMAEISIMVHPTDYQLRMYKKAKYTKARYLLSNKASQGLSLLDEGKTSKLLNELNNPCIQSSLADLFVHSFEDYLVTITSSISYNRYLINSFSKDLIVVSDKKLEDSIISIRKDLKDKLEKNDINHSQIKEYIKDSIKQLKEIEQKLRTATTIDPGMRASNKVQLLIAKDALVKREIGDRKGYQSNIEQLKILQSPYVKTVALYAENSKQQIGNQLENISKMPLNDLTAYTLLKYFDYVSKHSLYKQLKSFYQNNKEAKINMYLGRAAHFLSLESDAKRYLKIAMHQGDFEAAELLLNYTDKDDIHQIENIARLLNPEACFLVGRYYLNTKYGKALTYLKIAAAFEHFEALKLLSDMEFKRYKSGRRELPESQLQRIYKNALKLNAYVYEREDSNEVRERLGTLYYWGNDHRRAIDYLALVDNKDSNFICGKIYQYGDVLPQDLAKSKEYYERAMSQSHPQAQIEFHKVTGWIQSNRRENSYSRKKTYVSVVDTSRTNDSWCFLTTATCIALGKEDNCSEIIEYKKYRDKHLLFDEDGQELIVEYYRIAPEIVMKIESQKNSDLIYKQLYDKYIKVGYDYLQKNNLEKAKETYIKMVKELCEKYRITPFSEST